jgi:hypothetical protein
VTIQAEEVYCLLRDNYVEDDDCTFRYAPFSLYIPACPVRQHLACNVYRMHHTTALYRVVNHRFLCSEHGQGYKP